MTCIEKLRESRPYISESDIGEYIRSSCPHAFDIMGDPLWCNIPHEFELIWRNTIVYDAVDRIVEETKMHMTVLERVKQHYTGKLVYKIRRQSEEGWIDEDFYTEKEVREMLAARVDE